MSTIIVPSLIVTLSGSEQVMSTHSYELSYKRTICLGDIDRNTSDMVVSALYALDDVSHQDIILRINSSGGSISDGFAIIDAMNIIKSDVVTVCTGLAASMAAIILSCGTKGKRYITPLSDVMIHQPLGGVQGQASDISKMCERMLNKKDLTAKILALNTGKTKKKVIADIDRDYWMSATEAIEYGIVDKIYMGG